jgi:hypothetical protein
MAAINMFTFADKAVAHPSSVTTGIRIIAKY